MAGIWFQTGNHLAVGAAPCYLGEGLSSAQYQPTTSRGCLAPAYSCSWEYTSRWTGEVALKRGLEECDLEMRVCFLPNKSETKKSELVKVCSFPSSLDVYLYGSRGHTCQSWWATRLNSTGLILWRKATSLSLWSLVELTTLRTRL